MRILYFDCFSGAAGDMILGALLDAGLPFEALQQALGSLAVDGWQVSADRVLKGGITAVKFRVHELAAVASAADGRSRAGARASSSAGDPGRDRPLGAGRGGQGAGPPDVHPAGRGRGGHPRHARRAGAPPRGRRDRFDRRHRRRGVRAGMVRRRSHRRLADQRRGRHGPIGARRLPGAGAGDAAGARRRADLFERHPGRAADPDRRARPERVRHGLRPDAGDADRARRLRRRGPRAARDPQRGPGDGRHRCRRASRAVDARGGDGLRDRRHESPDLRGADGSAADRGRAGGVLPAGADEEEPAGHADDGGLPAGRPPPAGRSRLPRDDDHRRPLP